MLGNKPGGGNALPQEFHQPGPDLVRPLLFSREFMEPLQRRCVQLAAHAWPAKMHSAQTLATQARKMAANLQPSPRSKPVLYFKLVFTFVLLSCKAAQKMAV